MTLVVNAKNYNADSFSANSVGYIGLLKTVSVKDDLKLARVAPKPVLDSSGVGRSQFKLTRTLTLTGAKEPARDAIVEINVTVPVGYTAADVDALLNDSGAFCSSASAKAFVKSQQISF